MLMAHLLKWIFQPERRGISWIATIKGATAEDRSFATKNPESEILLDEAFVDGYSDARLIAVRETNLPERTFPETAPFALEQVLDDAYWPE